MALGHNQETPIVHLLSLLRQAYGTIQRRRCFALCLRRCFLSRSRIWTALRIPWPLSESDRYPIPEREFSFQRGRASMAGPAKQSQAVHCRSAQNTDAVTTTTYVKFDFLSQELCAHESVHDCGAAGCKYCGILQANNLWVETCCAPICDIIGPQVV